MNLILIAFIAICVYVFSPYVAQRWRTDVERWSTRERSFGHPYYQRLKDCGFTEGEYGRRAKQMKVCKNVILIE
jgi:hypothetical protein